MDLRLRSLVAAVAGGSRGLGFGVAQSLMLEGASCSIGSRSKEGLSSAEEKLKQLDGGGSVLSFPVDTSSSQSIDSWIRATISAFGRLDLLVVNTGGPPAGSFDSVSEEDWEEAFRKILLGATRLVRTALPELRKSASGSILFITSTSVRQPIDNLILSNVFRPAVAALAKTLSLELAADGIRVNVLMPGRIDTDRVRELDGIAADRKSVPPEEVRQRMESGIPLGRYGTIEEFGRMAAFLLSPAASYISGTITAVDGAMLRTI